MPSLQTSEPSMDVLNESVLDVALLCLYGPQIERSWMRFIRPVAQVYLGEQDQDDVYLLSNIYRQLIEESLRFYLIVAIDKAGNKFVFGGLLVHQYIDSTHGTKNLVIDGLLVNQSVPDRIWSLAFDKLRIIAKGLGCDQIFASTVSPRVVEIASLSGNCKVIQTLQMEV